MAATQSRADWYKKRGEYSEWADRLDISDYLADQFPSQAAAKRYCGYVKAMIARRANPPRPDITERLMDHLLRASSLSVSADDRGWFQFRRARLAGLGRSPTLEGHRLAWAQALEAGRDSIWSQHIRAAELIARVLLGRVKAAAAMSANEIAALLAEIESTKAGLASSPASPEKADLTATLAGLLNWWTGPILRVDVPQSVTPGVPVSLSFGTAGYDRLTVDLYRHTFESWGKRGVDLTEMFRAGIVPAPKAVAEELLKLQASAQKVNSLTVSLAGGADRTWCHDTITVTPPITSGFYTLVVQGENADASEAQISHFIASSAGVVTVTPTSGPGFVHVFDKKTGEPLRNAALSGMIASSDRKTVSLLPPTIINADGMAQLPPFLSSKRAYDSEEMSLLADGQPLFASRWFPDYSGGSQPYVVDVFVDRKLFRPGETVHWKVIARKWGDGRFVIPTERPKMSVQLHSESTEVSFFDSEIAFDAFGTVHGEFLVPELAREGSAYLKLTWPDRPSEDLYERDSVFMFRVDNYVPPAIRAQIELVGPPDSLRPGQVVRIQARAWYHSGGPVAGCPVSFGFDAASGHWPSLTVVQNARLERWAKELQSTPRQATTDAAGNAEIIVSVPSGLLPDSRLTISATLSPEGGQAVVESVVWKINPLGMSMANSDAPRLRLLRPGETATFSALVQDGRGQPCRFEGMAQLIEKKWYEAWLDPQGTLITGSQLAQARQSLKLDSKGILPAPWKKLHADYLEIPLAEAHVVAGAEGKLAVPFQIPYAGLFEMRLNVNGQLIERLAEEHWDQNPERGVIASDETTSVLDLRPDLIAVLAPAELREGEPLRLQVILPINQSWGLVSINGDMQTVVRRVTATNRVGYLEVSELPRFTGVGMASIVALEKPLMSMNGYAAATFQVTASTNLVNLTVDPEREVSLPGSSTSIRIQSANRAGVPQPTQIALAVTDEAVNRLFDGPNQAQPPFNAYTRVVRSLPEFPFRKAHQFPLKDPSDPRPGASFRITPQTEDYLRMDSREAWLEEDSEGYGASSSIAGSRIRTDFFDLGGAPSRIRTHFDATAFWAPNIVTNEKGEATVTFKYPDNLTQWRLEAYAVGADGNSFGRAATFTRTSLPFQARLQLPRFLVAGDTAEPSALLLNRTDADFTASAELKFAGPVAALDPTQLLHSGIVIPKQGEAHTAWTVQAKAPGTAEFTLTGHADTKGDAMMLPLPVLEDGIQQHIAASGRLAPDTRKLDLKLALPAPLDLQRTRVTVQLTPSHAAVVLDALPYLVDYPYGCVEQTMSRFLPAVIAQKTLTDLGLNAAAVEQRIVAGESKADLTRRTATAGLAKIDDVVQQGLGRLIEAQHYSGSFGWWPGAESTNLWMTAYVAWGLGLAKSAGVSIPDQLENDTWRSLVRSLPDETRVTDELAWALGALTAVRMDNEESTQTVQAAFTRVFADRNELSAIGRASLAQAAVRFGNVEQRAILLRNLENGAERVRADNLGDTVHWGKVTNYWNAMDGAVEATSLTLLALLELDPQHPLIEPAINWLVLNRRSAHWQSTRDSAFAVLALTRYIAQHRELGGELEADVFANGKRVGRVKLNRDSVLKGTGTIDVPAALLRAGANTLVLQRVAGTGPLYAVALGSAWAPGATVKPASHLIDVARGFIRQKAEPTLLGTLRITPQPLSSGGSAVAGEQVTAKVTLTVPNDLEYVMIEVPKPAGCEPLNPLSGWDAKIRRVELDAKPVKDDAEEGHAIYREERDEKSVFFLEKLAPGTWEIRFGMRAITPGDFRALPVQATAMYVPEITANSDAQRLKIQRVE